jgi:hypothetical protein
MALTVVALLAKVLHELQDSSPTQVRDRLIRLSETLQSEPVTEDTRSPPSSTWQDIL